MARKVSLEIKARCSNLSRVRKRLLEHGAVYKGRDHQIDTYFRVPSGRLKLREGRLENALIFYKRHNQKKSKRCDSELFHCLTQAPLKRLLTQAFGVLTVVDKRRDIYFIQNTKFHMDRVKRLGNFVEIEVFGPSHAAEKLKKQCEFYQRLLGIQPKDLQADSYSDQLLSSSKAKSLRKIQLKATGEKFFSGSR